MSLYEENVLDEKLNIGDTAACVHKWGVPTATVPVGNHPVEERRMVTKTEYEKLNDGDKVIVAVNCIMETMDLIEKNYDYTVNVNRGNQSLVERLKKPWVCTGRLKPK